MLSPSIRRIAPPSSAEGGCRLLAVLVAVLAALALMLPAPALAEEVLQVAHAEDGTVYTDADRAWSAAWYEGKVIVMDADWHLERAFDVASGSTVTLKMNGHKVYRDYNESDTGCIFRLLKGSTLNLIGSEKADTEFTVKGLVGLDPREDVTVTSGGLVTGGHSNNSGGAIEMKENSTLNLTNVAVAGNKAYSAHGGGVRTDGKNCTITMKNAQICYNAAASD